MQKVLAEEKAELEGMKVLFMTSRDITHPEWAGGDVYHFEVARRLVRSGNDVTMLCNKYNGCKSQEVLQGIRIMRIKGGVFRIISNFLTYHKFLRGRHDIIVEEAEGPAGPLFAFLYAKEPVVIMWHQLGKTLFFNQFPYPIALSLFVLEEIYVSLAHKCQIIVPSHDRAREFSDVSFSNEKINVVPAAFTLNKVADHLNSAMLEKTYFLILGKIRRYKAYHHAIEALKLLRDKGEKCSLIIVGKRGEERYCKKLEKLITKYGLHDSVFIRHNVSEDEKAKILANAFALIVTSPIEGFSIVSVEANALGVPVIATNGVPEEVVKDGFNGIKYKFGDMHALAETMSKLLHDHALREELSVNAAKSSSKFSWDVSAKLFEEALQKALEKEQKRILQQGHR
jgi:glycosyltransferase involved in cell wall biosynthesis